MTEDQKEALEVIDRWIKYSTKLNDEQSLKEALKMKEKVETQIANYEKMGKRITAILQALSVPLIFFVADFNHIITLIIAYIISYMISEILKLQNLIHDND